MPTRSLSRCANRGTSVSGEGRPTYSRLRRSNSSRNAGSALASAYTCSSSVNAWIRASGTNRPAEPAEIRAVMLRQRTAFRHLHTPAGLHQPLDGQIMTFGGGHALAHQHGVRAGAGVVLQLHRAEYAGFRHLDDVRRQRRGQFPVVAHVDGQILEIARVDADDARRPPAPRVRSPRRCGSPPAPSCRVRGSGPGARAAWHRPEPPRSAARYQRHAPAPPRSDTGW